MPDVKVALGYVHGDELANSFIDSRDALIAFDRQHYGVLAHDHARISVRGGTDGLVAARNMVASKVVESDVDWLLWIDTDMGFAATALYELLAVADPTERPVVGGLCFAARQFAHDGMNGFRTRPAPTIYDWVDVDGVKRFVSTPMYPVNELVECKATGSAFVLVHRTVFERIGDGWYDRLRGTDGSLLGEDISFCVRLGTAGIPIHVHTGVRTTHLKPQWLGETDHWLRYVPPPAAEPVAVLASATPTEMFTRTLRASTGLAAVRDQLAQVDEPWVLLANGDETFRAGWLDHAQHVADAFGTPVIGLNNPVDRECVDGVSATTLLVRRDYLAEHGSVDIAAARGRGEWTMALGAVAERPLPDPSGRAAKAWTVPRYAIIPTHNRPELLTALVASLGRQCDRIVVLDNASEPPVDEEQLQTAAGAPVLVLRDEEQPPHLSRYWNVMLDAVAEWAKDEDVYDVAVLNDDSIVPAGWYDACANGLRGHGSAVVAHTTPTVPALLTELHNQPGNRMTPHAFVIRGDLGMRADEAMSWWYFDTDLDFRARQAGGVLSVPGPQVVNARANSTTVGALAEQAGKDQATFEAKWSR